MEAIVASSIVAVVFLVTIPLLAHVRTIRSEADRRGVAWQEAANVMEQVALLARQGSVHPRATAQLTLSTASDTLPGAELHISIDPDPGPLPKSRVTVTVLWQTDLGEHAVPVTLVGWFPQEEGS